MLKRMNDRLTKQGFINANRKPVLAILTVIMAYVWIFHAPFFFTIPAMFRPTIVSVGILFLVFGIFGRAFSILTIGGKKDINLSTTEMYSIVRHPLYFSSLLMTIGFGMYSCRIDIFLMVVGSFFLVFYPMMINEEKSLTKTFGKPYEDYMKTTNRILPKFRNWKSRETVEFRVKTLLNNFFDASVILLVPVILAVITLIKTLVQ